MQDKRLHDQSGSIAAPDTGAATRDHYRVERRLLLKAMARTVTTYDAHAQVFDEIAKRLFERFDLLTLNPARILDLGTGNGRHLNELRRRYPRAEIVGADISHAALRAGTRHRWRQRLQRLWQPQNSLVCMDMGTSWPFADQSFDLVISNMALPWVSETDQFATELARVLADGGAFFFSSAGPDTLAELRQAWTAVDNCIHVNAFLDMHDVGDMFARAGLADPVMDTERIDVRYKDVESLLHELQATGCGCTLRGRRRGLMSAQVSKKIAASYPRSQTLDVDRADDSSSICASLELVVAHGWKQNKPGTGVGRDNERRNQEHIVHFQPRSWQSHKRL